MIFVIFYLFVSLYLTLASIRCRQYNGEAPFALLFSLVWPLMVPCAFAEKDLSRLLLWGVLPSKIKEVAKDQYEINSKIFGLPIYFKQYFIFKDEGVWRNLAGFEVKNQDFYNFLLEREQENEDKLAAEVEKERRRIAFLKEKFAEIES